MNIFWNGVEFRWQKWVIYSWKIFSWLNFTYKELDKQANISFKKIWILTTKIYNCNEQAKMTFWINFLIQNFITFFPVKTWGYFGLVNWYVFHFVFIDWKNIFWSVPPCINLLTYLGTFSLTTCHMVFQYLQKTEACCSLSVFEGLWKPNFLG